MYKLLLCLRYVRTRFIALASIISVTLGVATMIVVNAVMAGFAEEMQDRIRGILSDVSFEARSFNGFEDPIWHMQRIRELLGDDVESMTPTVHVPAMLSFSVNGEVVTRPVQLVGIEASTKSDASRFAEYLLHPENREQFSFELRDQGYPTVGADGIPRRGMEAAGWNWRRQRITYQREYDRQMELLRQREQQWEASQAALDPQQALAAAQQRRTAAGMAGIDVFDDEAESTTATSQVYGPPTASDRSLAAEPAPESNPTIDPLADDEPAADVPQFEDPFAANLDPPLGREFDPLQEQFTGCVLGIGLASFRRGKEEHYLALPGDDVQLTLPTAGSPPKATSDTFTIVDFYESKMSEYDGGFVFVPIERLQQLRGMIDPATGRTYVTSIQIKLKPGVHAERARDKLRGAFPEQRYSIVTWRDKQGPLLAAVHMETAILNVLLFLIVAVAGFGILAIFFMIVVEKTQDIGILKSLGASSSGVMGIFLSYGLSLGAIGAGAGLGLGLLFVHYINQIADVLSWVTGQEVFDPSIYYFYEIPARVDVFTVTWIVAGAMLIAVLAGVLPAFRAARLHPVEALRYA